MNEFENKLVDAHILEASKLRTTSRGYKALNSLLSTGNLLCIAFNDYSVFVDFTRLLNHLRLEFHFVPFGLQLNDNAKIDYHQNVMNKKTFDAQPTYYQNKSNRIGKEERGTRHWGNEIMARNKDSE